VILALKNVPAGAQQNGASPRVLIPEALHPEYREVLKTYLGPFYSGVEFYSGSPAAAAKAKAPLACLAVSYPDFFGVIPDLEGAAEAVHAAGGLFIVHADPLMLGLFKSPGEWGADMVSAEGQSLGNDMNYGGPFLGIMAVTRELMRKIPGRIVGEARDGKGRRGYVLTLSAREQHIRRERAVSNICSNQGLSMLRSAIYLALMGKQGLRRAAELCWHRAHYAASELAKLPGFTVAEETKGGGIFFKEFTVKLPENFSSRRRSPGGNSAPSEPGEPVPGGKSSAQAVFDLLYKKNIVPGLPLSRYFPDRTNELLVCVTENNSKSDIDRLTAALGELYE
jgi:glycine dehydrogenase subunit 1